MIKKVGSKYVIYSSKGKRLGEFTSRKQAQLRENEIKMFKHMAKNKTMRKK